MHITADLYSKDPIILPSYYNRILQDFIYKILQKEFAEFLHDNGCKNVRSFKLFACSGISSEQETKKYLNLINFGNKITLVISSPYDDICEWFTNSSCRKILSLGSNRVNIGSIKIEQQLVLSDTIIVKTLSPILVYKKIRFPNGKKQICCYQPGEDEFQKLCSENLKKKYTLFYNKEAPSEGVKITSLVQPVPHLLEQRRTILKCYDSLLGLSGPRGLLQMAMDCGLGRDNTRGFGLVRLA